MFCWVYRNYLYFSLEFLIYAFLFGWGFWLSFSFRYFLFTCRLDLECSVWLMVFYLFSNCLFTFWFSVQFVLIKVVGLFNDSHFSVYTSRFFYNLQFALFFCCWVYRNYLCFNLELRFFVQLRFLIEFFFAFFYDFWCVLYLVIG